MGNDCSACNCKNQEAKSEFQFQVLQSKSHLILNFIQNEDQVNPIQKSYNSKEKEREGKEKIKKGALNESQVDVNNN